MGRGCLGDLDDFDSVSVGSSWFKKYSHGRKYSGTRKQHEEWNDVR